MSIDHVDHRAAKGQPAPKPKQYLEWAQEQHPRWQSPSAWYSATRPDGVEIAQARVSYIDGEGEHELKSDIFELVRAADPQPVDAYSFINPQAEMNRRLVEAQVVYARLTEKQRSPLDMCAIADELQRDASYYAGVYQRELERKAERKAKSDAAVEAFCAIDFEFVTDEQHDRLLKLLGNILQEKK